MEFEPVEFFQGLMGTILVFTSILVAGTILVKYFKHKNIQFLLVGMTWLGMASPWIPDSITFFLVLTTGEKLPLLWVFIIGYLFIPLYIVCWTVAASEFLIADKKKQVTMLVSIILGIAEVVFIVLLATDMSYLAEQLGPFQLRFGLFMMIYLFGIIIYAVVTGILFARKALQSDNKEIKLKGKFLLIAFISFCVGAVIEAVMHITPTTILITKSILISSSIEFFIGFTMPEFIKRTFLKE